jgi:hypothetical protein
VQLHQTGCRVLLLRHLLLQLTGLLHSTRFSVSMRTLQRRMPVAWTHRCAVVCRACVRELLYMAVIVSLTLVNLNQRILADICIVAEQRHEQQLAGAYRTLCSSKASAQHLSTSWSSSMKVIATYPWQGLASLWVSHHCQLRMSHRCQLCTPHRSCMADRRACAEGHHHSDDA